MGTLLLLKKLTDLLHNNNVQHVLLFALLISLLTLTYWPTLTVNYAFADDYFCLWNRVCQPNWIYYTITEGVLQARPLNGTLVVLALANCKSIADYIFFHTFTIFQLAILAYLTCRLLIQCGWTKVQSIFLSLSLLSLPPIQVIACWAAVTFFVLSSIFALISINLAMFWETKFSAHSIKRLLIAFICMLLSITIYQPWSMFYWVGAAICLTSHSFTREQKRSYLIRFVAIFSSAALADLLMLRIATACFRHIAVSPERTHITSHIPQKISWFITGPLVDALNFNYLMVSEKIAIFSGLFILLGLWFHFQSTKKWQTLLDWSIALSFIPLSYLPNLAIAESYYTYRTELGLSTLILFYAYLSARALLKNIWKDRANYVLTLFVATTSIFNLITANSHVINFFVNPQMHELGIMKAQLRGDLGKAKQLHPVYSERKDTTAPFNRHDEFGMPSFACPWIREPGTILLRDEISKESQH